jgi:hypothetical protein
MSFCGDFDGPKLPANCRHYSLACRPRNKLRVTDEVDLTFALVSTHPADANPLPKIKSVAENLAVESARPEKI